MGKIINNKVIFFNIVPILFILISVYSFCASRATNTITKEIHFDLFVTDSLLVAKAKDLDFGNILKGTTDTIYAETAIEISNGENNEVKVKLSYDLPTTKEVDKNYTSIQIKYKEPDTSVNKSEIKNINKDERAAVETIDVYLKNFEDSYTIQGNDNANFIPVKGEIRGIGEAKIGEYEGTVRVNIEVLSSTRKLEEVNE